MFELIKDILNLPSIQQKGAECLKEIDNMFAKIKKTLSFLKRKKTKEETYENE